VVSFTHSGFTPGTDLLAPSEPKGWWTAERVRMATSTEKYHTSAENRTAIPPTVQCVNLYLLRLKSDMESIEQLGSSS